MQKSKVREPVIINDDTSFETSHVINKYSENVSDDNVCQASPLVISGISDCRSEADENPVIDYPVKSIDITVECCLDEVPLDNSAQPIVSLNDVSIKVTEIESHEIDTIAHGCMMLDTIDKTDDVGTHPEGKIVLETTSDYEETTNNDVKSASELLEQFNLSISDAMTLTTRVNKDPLEHGQVHRDEIIQEDNVVHRENGVMVYGELQRTLKELVSQEDAVPNYFEATAPVIECESESSSRTVLSEQCEESTDIAAHTAVEHKKISKLHFEDVVRPFTETQIKSLYYNSELEANEQFIQKFVDVSKPSLYIRSFSLKL